MILECANSGSEQTYTLFIVSINITGIVKCKLFLQLVVLNHDDWGYFIC